MPVPVGKGRRARIDVDGGSRDRHAYSDADAVIDCHTHTLSHSTVLSTRVSLSMAAIGRLPLDDGLRLGPRGELRSEVRVELNAFRVARPAQVALAA